VVACWLTLATGLLLGFLFEWARYILAIPFALSGLILFCGSLLQQGIVLAYCPYYIFRVLFSSFRGSDLDPEVRACIERAADEFARGKWSAASGPGLPAVPVDGIAAAEMAYSRATLFLASGDIRSALSLVDGAESIWLESVELDDSELVDVLISLALICQWSGERGRAEAHFRRGHEVASRGRAPLQRHNAFCLRGMADLHAERGESAEAERLYREAVRLLIEPGQRSSGHVLATIDGLINCLWACGKDAEREPFMLEALRATFAAFPDGHPFLADRLDDLGRLYHSLGRFDWAEALYRRAGEIRERRFGRDTPLYALSLTNLGELYAATDRPDRAYEFLRGAAVVEDALMARLTFGRTEREQNAYVLMFQPSLFRFVSLVLDHFAGDHSAVRAAFDLVLRRKSVGVEAQALARGAALAAKYPRLAPLMDRLNRLRWEIARAAVADHAGGASDWGYRRMLTGWMLEKEQIEERLAREIPELRRELQVRATDRRSLRQVLPDGSVLVEFLRLFPFQFSAALDGGPRWGVPRYVAFVHPSAVTLDVEMIDLGEAGQIDELISELRSHLASGGASDRDRDLNRVPPGLPSGREDAGRLIFDAVLRPLLPVIADRRRLFIAPDGALFLLPLEVLPCGGGRRVIDEFEVSYLSAGRDLVRLAERRAVSSGAPLVMADPDYDRSTEVDGFAVAASPRRPTFGPDDSAGLRDAGRSRDLVDTGFLFDGLPGTRIEGERIGLLLRVTPLTRDRATEGALKSARSPRVLHLATHGFFLPDQVLEGERVGSLLDTQPWMEEAILRARRAVCSQAIQAQFMSSLALAFVRPQDVPMLEDTDQERVRLRRVAGGAAHLVELEWENPLLRSGLALAAANLGLVGGGPDAGEDGLLTAEEVAGLELSGTELVVLSACDTGLGEIRTGEGVFGLRRAFFMAGARTLVLSLWKVSDLATTVLMERFYENLTGRGLGRSAALREAQLALRDITLGELRKVGLALEVIGPHGEDENEGHNAQRGLSLEPEDYRPFADPYYWGAFICQGDPAPLDLRPPGHTD
jgi:CHAT domain-containing protein/tetratricopeptide (TPR) repeat protein